MHGNSTSNIGINSDSDVRVSRNATRILSRLTFMTIVVIVIRMVLLIL